MKFYDAGHFCSWLFQEGYLVFTKACTLFDITIYSPGSSRACVRNVFLDTAIFSQKLEALSGSIHKGMTIVTILCSYNGINSRQVFFFLKESLVDIYPVFSVNKANPNTKCRTCMRQTRGKHLSMDWCRHMSGRLNTNLVTLFILQEIWVQYKMSINRISYFTFIVWF